MTDVVCEAAAAGLKEQLRIERDVMNFWLYALDKVGWNTVQEGWLGEVAADYCLEQVFSHWGIQWRLFDKAIEACRWYVYQPAIRTFMRQSSIELFERENDKVGVFVASGCPYEIASDLLDRQGISACRRAELFMALIKRCTGRDYDYELESYNPVKGCHFTLYPTREKYRVVFSHEKVVELIKTFTEEAEAIFPGLIESTGKKHAMKISGNLAEGLTEFGRAGLGLLSLKSFEHDKGRAVFSGKNLLQGSTGKSNHPVDTFARGFLAGLVERIAGVEVECTEVTCLAKGDAACTFVVQVTNEQDRDLIGKIFQQPVKVGYMPTFHHLTLLAAKDLGLTISTTMELEPVKYQTWHELSESLQQGRLDGAFVMAPLALWLRQKGVPIKIVALGHHEGIGLVVPSAAPIQNPAQLLSASPLIAVPHKYSTHNILLKKIIFDHDLDQLAASVKTVSVHPAAMLSSLAYGELDGFMGPEPYVTEADTTGKGRILAWSKDIWPKHICCVLVFTTLFLDRNRDEVVHLVRGIRQAGERLQSDRRFAAGIAGSHLGVARDWTMECLAEDRIDFSNLQPDVGQLEIIQEQMLAMKLLDRRIPMDDLVDSSIWRSSL